MYQRPGSSNQPVLGMIIMDSAARTAGDAYRLTAESAMNLLLWFGVSISGFAGGYNVLLIGRPGSGKTMPVRRLPTILPRMTFEEAIETTPGC